MAPLVRSRGFPPGVVLWKAMVFFSSNTFSTLYSYPFKAGKKA